MASSKFSRSKHNFRIPDVCKKKLEAVEAPPPPIPYPPPFVDFWYDCDLNLLPYHYAFTGTNTLKKKPLPDGHTWWWTEPGGYPYTGAWCYFNHNYRNGIWIASLTYYYEGIPKLTGHQTDFIQPGEANLDTGLFELNTTWRGKKDAQVTAAAGT